MKQYALSLSVLLILLTACSDGQDSNNTLANQAGETVGTLVSDFTEGIGKGVDQTLSLEVEADRKLTAKGITISVAKQGSLAEKTIVVYLNSDQRFNESIIIQAFNAAGQEVGRSTVVVDLEADSAKYVSFPFYGEMDTQLVDKYVATVP